MNHTIFLDESGTAPPDKTYAIGCLAVPDERLEWFADTCRALAKRHRVSGELHWTDLRASYAPANFGLELFELVLLERLVYSIIVVEKRLYQNWQSGPREEAFYKSLSLLLRDLVGRRLGRGEHRVLIDERQDSYGKRTEVVEIVGNRMLRQLAAAGKIKGVETLDSRDHHGIQAADFFTGAIRTARELYVTNNERTCNYGKRVVMGRMAEFLGWDGLHRDTMPRARSHKHFNVWHFPALCRGRPGSMRVQLQPRVRLIGHDDMRPSRRARVGSRMTAPRSSQRRGKATAP